MPSGKGWEIRAKLAPAEEEKEDKGSDDSGGTILLAILGIIVVWWLLSGGLSGLHWGASCPVGYGGSCPSAPSHRVDHTYGGLAVPGGSGQDRPHHRRHEAVPSPTG